MKKRSSSKIIKKYVYPIVSFMLLLAIIAIIMNITGTQDKIASFYISHDGNVLINNVSSVTLSSTEENRFDIKTILSDEEEYSVKIKSSDKVSFSYLVDGQIYSYKGLELTQFFNITKEKGYFLIDGNFSLQSILSAMHQGAEITLPSSMPDDVDYFILNITVPGINNEVNVYFYSDCTEPVTGVSIQESLEF